MRNKKLIAIFSILLAITFIVFLSSMLFSVKTIVARCENIDLASVDSSQTDIARDNIYDRLSQNIVDISDFAMGKSIFLVDESEIKSSVEKEIPEVIVDRIERKFPNRITIHYSKLDDYFEISYGTSLYSLRFDGRVVSVYSLPKVQSEKITIIFDDVSVKKKGEYLFGEQSHLSDLIISISKAFDNIDFGQKPSAIIRFIDFDIEDDYLYMGIEDNQNTMLKISHPYESIEAKINLGLSIYYDDDFSKNEHGMILVSSATSATATRNDYHRFLFI
jgi:hypothetical protein